MHFFPFKNKYIVVFFVVLFYQSQKTKNETNKRGTKIQTNKALLTQIRMYETVVGHICTVYTSHISLVYKIANKRKLIRKEKSNTKNSLENIQRQITHTYAYIDTYIHTCRCIHTLYNRVFTSRPLLFLVVLSFLTFDFRITARYIIHTCRAFLQQQKHNTKKIKTDILYSCNEADF